MGGEWTDRQIDGTGQKKQEHKDTHKVCRQNNYYAVRQKTNGYVTVHPLIIATT